MNAYKVGDILLLKINNQDQEYVFQFLVINADSDLTILFCDGPKFNDSKSVIHEYTKKDHSKLNFIDCDESNGFFHLTWIIPEECYVVKQSETNLFNKLTKFIDSDKTIDYIIDKYNSLKLTPKPINNFINR